jgi:FtsP/CotA-like multicopper oxidase with cupredoxin domain
MRTLLRYRGERRALRAFAERQELVKSGLTRRDLVKVGLMTGGGVGGGLLVSEKGMAAELRSPRALGGLPPLAPFVQALTVLPALPARDRATLSPAPAVEPNRATNPATGLPFEGRTEPHVSEGTFSTGDYYVTRIAANPHVRIHPDTSLPEQTVWGFNLGGEDLSADPALSPGPVLVLHYGTPAIVRRYNDLPAPGENGGFGVPEVSTHLHNFHSGTDSDGGPCDPVEQRFFIRGQYRDYYYNMQFAGWNSTHPDGNLPGVRGDVREALGFLWYHDHRVDHTAENTYKGLVGPSIIFNDIDTGDESTGLHLPSFPEFDIPLVFADKLLDPTTGLLAFDTFNFDGLLGNVFLVNGKVQPFFNVQRRRYRFRLLDGGPSRFYQLFLTNPDDLSQSIPFWIISNCGNLLPVPIKSTSYQAGVGERTDVIVDFAKIAQQFGASRLRLENRLEQVDGRRPTGKILAAGQGDQLLEFRITGGAVSDGSVDLDTAAGRAAYAPPPLPDISQARPRLTRTFDFDRGDGQWKVNGEFMDCTRFRFRPQVNEFERWIIKGHGGWVHPVHIHFEEFRILTRNGRGIGPGDVEFARKDVLRVGAEEVEILIRFRDMTGGYPIHCHNTIHEDHQMMMLYEVSHQGDTLTQP